MRRDRAVVDDAAAARVLVLHDPERFLRAEERAGQVHVDDGLPLLEGQIFQRHGGAPTPALLKSRSSRPKCPSSLRKARAPSRFADIRGTINAAASAPLTPAAVASAAPRAGPRVRPSSLLPPGRSPPLCRCRSCAGDQGNLGRPVHAKSSAATRFLTRWMFPLFACFC